MAASEITQSAQSAPHAQPPIERKASVELVEDTDAELGKKPGQVGGLEVLDHEIIEVSQEDNDRLRKLFDKRILPILTWVYFLQILDKFVFGYGNIYGMSTDLGLVGTQYSLASTMNNIAQLAWMPFSAYLIVRVPANILMPILVFGWGASATAMGGSQNLAALSAFRFLLGLFEAGCLPLFSVITAHYYRRSEQPVRVAIWYATNGLGQIVSSLLSYAFGTIQSPSIESWRILFIFVGLLTVLTAPVVWWMLPPDIQRCKFLTEDDKAKAIERVRANQTGTGSNVFKWDHVWEALYDPKTYLLGSLAICINFGATVTTAFGPTLIRDIGFTKEQAALLNSPFGALQSLTICAGAYLAQRFKMKGIILGIMTLPVLAGVAMLYVANSAEERDRTTALAGYYMMAFLFAGNPLIVSWMVANTGGQTKKSVILSFYNAFNATGSIIGPLQFSAADAPRYLPGLRKALGVFSAFIGINIICFGLLWILNKQRERQRVAVGKPAKIRDTSMLAQYETYGREGGLGENAMKDMTDWKNNEFTYVY